MKAVVTLLILLIPFVGFCQDCPNFPELTDSTFSFYPDTIENIDSAYVGQYFEDFIYFESPSVIGDIVPSTNKSCIFSIRWFAEANSFSNFFLLLALSF
jgi:hypothetical protein